MIFDLLSGFFYLLSFYLSLVTSGGGSRETLAGWENACPKWPGWPEWPAEKQLLDFIFIYVSISIFIFSIYLYLYFITMLVPSGPDDRNGLQKNVMFNFTFIYLFILYIFKWSILIMVVPSGPGDRNGLHKDKFLMFLSFHLSIFSWE